ncbi:hypothetical protein Ocin01_17743 [Orchesella cincta]|uniref:ISXO2-like transposase domain-containing protein n=1 Tax=Orchesella cincta TaxID=48709 RepID=A0A1D2M7K3_ORCCI|nr:hypothetical protein Ocin01_17743 [Orchesella cincta]
MAVIHPKLSLTPRDVFKLFNDAPFGLTSFGRQVRNDLDAFSLAIHTGLVDISIAPTCSCGNLNETWSEKRNAENSYQGFQWECGKTVRGYRCRQTISITSGTFFNDVRFSWIKVWDLCLNWFFQTPVINAGNQVGCGKDAAMDWYSFCREVCYDVVFQMDMCIGGGLHVEIDETHLFKRKYNRGRQLAAEHVWVFGGICRESKEAFVQVVPNRSGNTLWPIIQHRVHPVNHRYHFVDPNNPNVHTNTIERTWGLLKGTVHGSMNNERLEMYLGEFIYRRHFFKAITNTDKQASGRYFEVFLQHVREMYPGTQNGGM